MHKLRYGKTLTSVSFVSDEMELGMYACYLKKFSIFPFLFLLDCCLFLFLLICFLFHEFMEMPLPGKMIYCSMCRTEIPMSCSAALFLWFCWHASDYFIKDYFLCC
jgi:hypothetical protein